MKYRKKPVVIDAIQLQENNIIDVLEFMGQDRPVLNTRIQQMSWERYCDYVKTDGLTIKTLEDGPDGRAVHVASVGDFIIKGINGEFYPCKPDIFEKTYDPV